MAGSFARGRSTCLSQPTGCRSPLDQKVASIFLVRLPATNPKEYLAVQKEKNYADISEAKGKAIAFANRASDPNAAPNPGLEQRNLIGSDRR